MKYLVLPNRFLAQLITYVNWLTNLLSKNACTNIEVWTSWRSGGGWWGEAFVVFNFFFKTMHIKFSLGATAKVCIRFFFKYAHACVHTHEHTHTHICADTNTHVHTHTHAYTGVHMQIRQTFMYIYISIFHRHNIFSIYLVRSVLVSLFNGISTFVGY